MIGDNYSLSYLEPKGSVPCSQEPIIRLCPQPDKSIPQPYSQFQYA